VDQIFRAQQAGSFGIVRRSIADVHRYDALDEILARAQANGWHVVETGGQIVVLCHNGAMNVLC